MADVNILCRPGLSQSQQMLTSRMRVNEDKLNMLKDM